MSNLLDAAFKADIYTGNRTLFNDVLNNREYAPQSSILVEEVTSKNLQETYDWLIDNFGLGSGSTRRRSRR
ncbi:hypothetical protein OV079_00140 [Nannocystis pusilla]|uniref:Uncharacterized protein n=1 Tax=Nannocystis pusilla TaxID=889268 RepID=A0A9X3IU34_9BACT|nr:hypothetical protein [Nannocystis pusilla]MCY1004001.1 hypothetical protein [Nannocystis pusilla]